MWTRVPICHKDPGSPYQQGCPGLPCLFSIPRCSGVLANSCSQGPGKLVLEVPQNHPCQGLSAPSTLLSYSIYSPLFHPASALLKSLGAGCLFHYQANMLISEPSTSILANSQLQCLKCIEINFHYFFSNIDIVQTPHNPQIFLAVGAGYHRSLCGDFLCNLCPKLMSTLSWGKILLRRFSTLTQIPFSLW